MTETTKNDEDTIDGLKLFYGDGTEDAQLWKKKFILVMLTRTAVVAVAQRDRLAAGMFAGYMRPGEAGEEWLETLTVAQQESWASISANFDVKWPQEQRRVETHAEKWEAFETNNFDIGDLGTKVEHNSRKVHAHSYYADELFKAGKRCAGMPDVALITSAMKRLPDSLRRLMRARTTNGQTWREWTDSLRQLTLEEAQEEQRFYDVMATTQTQQRQLQDQVQALQIRDPSHLQRIGRANTMSGLGLNLHPFGTPLPQYQSNTSSGSQTPSTPSTPNSRCIESAPLPPVPDTPQNRAKVAKDRDEWNRMHPSGVPYANSDYPLTPGTLPASGNACPHCGRAETSEHTMYMCRNEPLEQKEQEFRRNVRAKIRRFNRIPATPGTPTPVFWMSTDNGGTVEVGEEDLALMLDNELGNEQEAEH